MSVSLIAAIAANRVIGNRGALPWRLPDDLARFRRLTMRHAVVMGRQTFDSMGKPLPGRRNIVLTRDTALQIPGCRVKRCSLMCAGRSGVSSTKLRGVSTLMRRCPTGLWTMSA